jgi:hypothetical protein
MATHTFQNGDGPYQLFPTTIDPESIEIRHPRRTLVADSRSMRRQSRSIGGVRIEATFKFPPMHKSEYADLASFFRLIDGRNTIFAMRWPLLRDDSSYTDTALKIGEYYNRDSSSLNNQLMQYVGLSGSTPIVDPPARDTGTVALRVPNSSTPTLKCSLNTDTPTIEYGGDGFIRYSLDVVERW